jgi:hypothetical protein
VQNTTGCLPSKLTEFVCDGMGSILLAHSRDNLEAPVGQVMFRVAYHAGDLGGGGNADEDPLLFQERLFLEVSYFVNW